MGAALWLGLAVVFAALIAVGWRLHLWWCQRRMGCPVWIERDARVWTAKLAAHDPNGKRERHPTPEAKLLDEKNGKGIPFQRRETPTAETDLTNPTRRRTP